MFWRYFYGEDRVIERALKVGEDAYALGVAQILQPGYTLNDEHRLLLRRFWLLQHLRTEAASRRATEMLAAGLEVAGAQPKAFRPTVREAVRGAINIFASAIDTVDDLKVCLVRNRTNIPFITSDDPAVVTNRWYFEDDRAARTSVGLQSSGALALLPLSPTVLCLLYDGDVYSVPRTGGWVDAKHERDIEALNQHQYFTCYANVYFRERADAPQIAGGFEAVASLRPVTRHRIHYLVLDHSENGSEVFRRVDGPEAEAHRRALIRFEMVMPKPSSWPSQNRVAHGRGCVYQWNRRGLYSSGSACKNEQRRVS
jgi:hypothetical protein